MQNKKAGGRQLPPRTKKNALSAGVSFRGRKYPFPLQVFKSGQFFSLPIPPLLTLNLRFQRGFPIWKLFIGGVLRGRAPKRFF